MMRDIQCVALELTTCCDRACPDCCANINRGERPAVHHSWEYFERAATFLRGIHRLHLTGGEPTTHPQFAEFVPQFRDLFGCKTMTLQTDGFGLRRWGREKYLELLKHFDFVYPSRYDERNAEAADLVRIEMPGKTSEWSGPFTPRSRRGSGAVCFRGLSDTVAYADGQLHGCCVSPGIVGAQTLEPCADWRDKIQAVPLPCGDCFFSPEAA